MNSPPPCLACEEGRVKDGRCDYCGLKWRQVVPVAEGTLVLGAHDPRVAAAVRRRR